MSGPVGVADAPPEPAGAAPGTGLEVTESRMATVGDLPVRRALPRRGRRTVGAWCFADHMGPIDAEAGPDIGPHPHIGLQTVTWLLEGQLLHRDSLGSEQVIRPGQLNLMTAGNGVAHAEESTGHHRGRLEGMQLWLAQPDATRTGPAGFEHHPQLPGVAFAGATVTVLVGAFADRVSPARQDTPTVGAHVELSGGATTLPLRRGWEYALVVLRGAVQIGATTLPPGRLGYLGLGREELGLTSTGPSTALLLGGEPFPERIVMWWNFVARSQEEMAAARSSWQTDDGRFGAVRSRVARIEAPVPFWRE